MTNLTLSCLATADDYPLRDLVECTPRGGLPNFFAKLEAGKKVTIAYFGGSITAQPGYRVLSEKWFEEQYPEADITGIHAAIGGTGSNLGAFRLKRDVLDHNPDLMFVEFAVNDSSTGPEQITRTMEGIVRQTRTLNPACDILFVYTVVARDMDTLLAGKMKRSASVMEAVADHYAIPSIHMGVEVTQLVREGKLVMKFPGAQMTAVSGEGVNFDADELPVNEDGIPVFAKDGVHPFTNTGHHLYMEAIERSIPAIKAAGKPGTQTLPPPLDDNNWEQAKMIALTEKMMTGPVQQLPPDHGLGKSFGQRMPSVWKLEPGATLNFKFTGSVLYIYDLMGPGCGMVKVEIDGKNTRKIKRMDPYCTYTRLSMLGLGNKFNPDELHTVKITVLDEIFDKRSILFEKNRGDVDKDPAKYAEINWYPGAIMLVGELIE